jgi:hypothetical protein
MPASSSNKANPTSCFSRLRTERVRAFLKRHNDRLSHLSEAAQTEVGASVFGVPYRIRTGVAAVREHFN